MVFGNGAACNFGLASPPVPKPPHAAERRASQSLKRYLKWEKTNQNLRVYLQSDCQGYCCESCCSTSVRDSRSLEARRCCYSVALG